jgi:hypothetical protein
LRPLTSEGKREREREREREIKVCLTTKQQSHDSAIDLSCREWLNIVNYRETIQLINDNVNMMYLIGFEQRDGHISVKEREKEIEG